MRTCDEMIQEVYERGEKYFRRKKRQKKILINCIPVFSAVCAGTLLSVFLWDREPADPAGTENIKEGIQFTLTDGVCTSHTSEITSYHITTQNASVHTSSSECVTTTTTVALTQENIVSESSVLAQVYTDIHTTPEIINTSFCTSSEIAVATETTTAVTTSTQTTSGLVSSMVVQTGTAQSTTITEESIIKIQPLDENSVLSGSCGEELWFSYEKETRTLYFSGTGSWMDVKQVEHLIGHFDNVYIERDVKALGDRPSNYLFGRCYYVQPSLTVYHYSGYEDVPHLEYALGAWLELVNLEE